MTASPAGENLSFRVRVKLVSLRAGAVKTRCVIPRSRHVRPGVSGLRQGSNEFNPRMILQEGVKDDATIGSDFDGVPCRLGVSVRPRPRAGDHRPTPQFFRSGPNDRSPSASLRGSRSKCGPRAKRDPAPDTGRATTARHCDASGPRTIAGPGSSELGTGDRSGCRGTGPVNTCRPGTALRPVRPVAG